RAEHQHETADEDRQVVLLNADGSAVVGELTRESIARGEPQDQERGHHDLQPKRRAQGDRSEQARAVTGPAVGCGFAAACLEAVHHGNRRGRSWWVGNDRRVLDMEPAWLPLAGVSMGVEAENRSPRRWVPHGVARRFPTSSSGRPWTSSFPAWMYATRCVVTNSVTPRPASSASRSHSSRRATGSIPAV